MNKPPIEARHPSDFLPEELEFWGAYGITKEELELFRVYAVDLFTTNKGKQIRRREGSLIFAYQVDLNCIKIYQPFNKKCKFSWIGTKPEDHIFGLNQLPSKGKTVVLTGGEKDVITLKAHGVDAISLNSETANLPDWLVQSLKPRFEHLIVLYDNDATGKTHTEKLVKQHGISAVYLPNEVEKIPFGKDISDFFKTFNNFSPPYEDMLQGWIEKSLEETDRSQEAEDKKSIFLPELQRVTEQLRQKKAQVIEFGQAILSRERTGVIFPRSITVIQGKAGTHKSRLAELICACFLNNGNNDNEFLGFQPDYLHNHTICYVDTERNLEDQFPAALQRVLNLSGHHVQDNPPNFYYTSLINIQRPKRMEALKDFIEDIRHNEDGSLVVVLDVLSDCLFNFNDPKESLSLIDLLNNYINNHNLSFICLIHENPGQSNKARGHLGTELTNKATTIMQVAIEEDDTEGIEAVKVDFIKCRNTKKIDPFYAQYDSETTSLIQVDQWLEEHLKESSIKATKNFPHKLIDCLSNDITLPLSRSDLLAKLTEKFGVAERTLERKLKRIIEEHITINNGGKKHTLAKVVQNRETFYKLLELTL